MQKYVGYHVDNSAEGVGAVGDILVVKHLCGKHERHICAQMHALDLNVRAVKLVKAAIERRHRRIIQRAAPEQSRKDQTVRYCRLCKRKGERKGYYSRLEFITFYDRKLNAVAYSILAKKHQFS